MKKKTEHIARIAKILSVDARVRIVCLLKGRSLCVSSLTRHLGITQGAVSQHLRIMRDAGLVIDEKKGYFVHYRINTRTLAAWHAHLSSILADGNEANPACQGGTQCVAVQTKKAAVKSRKTSAKHRKTARRRR